MKNNNTTNAEDPRAAAVSMTFRTAASASGSGSEVVDALPAVVGAGTLVNCRTGVAFESRGEPSSRFVEERRSVRSVCTGADAAEELDRARTLVGADRDACLEMGS
jgi:hypothetical protein